MNVTVQRRWLTPQSTIGDLSIAGQDAFHVYSLELREHAGTLGLAIAGEYVDPWDKRRQGFAAGA